MCNFSVMCDYNIILDYSVIWLCITEINSIPTSALLAIYCFTAVASLFAENKYMLKQQLVSVSH